MKTIPIDINWRRRIWQASPAAWAYIYWLKFVSNFSMRACVALTLCYLSGLDLFGYWPISVMYGLAGLALVCETVRFVMILCWGKLVFVPETEMDAAEEAAVSRARGVLR